MYLNWTPVKLKESEMYQTSKGGPFAIIVTGLIRFWEDINTKRKNLNPECDHLANYFV